MNNIFTGPDPIVPAASIAAMWVTLFITAVLPLLGWIFLAKKWKHASIAIAAGALGFFVPQVLIRIPALSMPSISGALAGLYGWNSLA